MSIELTKEELYLTDGLARTLYTDWGYTEATRQPDYLKLKKPSYKDNPLIGNRYNFDYWQLTKEEIYIEILDYYTQKKSPKRFIQYWLENPYYGIRIKDRSVDIVCSILLNKLSPNTGLIENEELQTAMRGLQDNPPSGREGVR